MTGGKPTIKSFWNWQHRYLVGLPMVESGIDSGYACKLIQYGWETVTEALKHGGITTMMDRLSNPAKLEAFELAEELKEIMRPLVEKHMYDIEIEADARDQIGKVKALGWDPKTQKLTPPQPGMRRDCNSQGRKQRLPISFSFCRNHTTVR